MGGRQIMYFIWSKKEVIRSTVTVCVLHFRGRAQLLEQIQKHLEEKENERKMREQEKQQIKENHEKMEKDDLKVHTLKRTNANTVQCTGVSFISDRLLCSRLKRRIGWSSSVCRRSCTSMLRPSEPSSRGWRRRSWLTLKPWNTSKRNRSAGKATELCRSATDVCSLLIFYCLCRRGTRNVKQSKSG